MFVSHLLIYRLFRLAGTATQIQHESNVTQRCSRTAADGSSSPLSVSAAFVMADIGEFVAAMRGVPGRVGLSATFESFLWSILDVETRSSMVIMSHIPLGHASSH